MPEFQGFPPAGLAFLRELAAHNERDWFNAHKDRYESGVREPALDFIATIGPKLRRISDHFEAIPTRAGGSLMRIHRDTRFAKDKTPYKTNVGIQFRHESGKDVHAPGYYLHLEPGECFLGVGLYRPEPGALAAIRARIAERPDDWRRASRGRAFTNVYTLGGDSLKRPPRGFPADAPYMDDLKRKDFIASTPFDEREAARPDFVDSVVARYRKATPFMRFLCDAVAVGF